MYGHDLFIDVCYDTLSAGLGCVSQEIMHRSKHMNPLCMQGIDVTDEELMTYISESSTMSKALEEYEGTSTSLSRLLLLVTSSMHLRLQLPGVKLY